MVDYDVVIVGSGFGGAVAACRLAEKGKRVLVLERGRRWTTEEYPRKPGDAWVYDSAQPHRRHGWFDVRYLDREMVVVCGAGVGGGSLVYANVTVNAPEEVFKSGWPSAIDYEALQPYYERVGNMLRPNVIPQNQHPVRLELMRSAALAVGASDRFSKVELAVTFDDNWSPDLDDPTGRQHSKTWTNRHGVTQGTCTHCGNCDLGCPVDAKNTLDVNYLAVAEKHGAVIQPLSQVSHVSRTESGWRLHYRDVGSSSRAEIEIDAPRVILSAGSLGTTEILLRSRDEFGTLPDLPRALGKGWSSNGDFVTPAWYRGRDISPTSGPTITSAIDFLDGARGGRYYIEDGGLPNLPDVLFDARRRSVRSRLMRRLYKRGELASVMLWFGQAIDASDGDFYLGRRPGRPWHRALRLNWNPLRSETPIDAMSAMHHELTRATGGKPLPRLLWSWFRGLVTPHPLGGCNMSTSPGTGVVDDAGRVFGHDGLYVMDGSIIPRAIGRNPSKTIAAVSERAVERLLAEMA